MGTHPRLATVAYGSLLDPATLGELFDGIDGRVQPVKLQGFKRVFNQEASWRDVDDDQRAVLNVVPAEDAWCNGIVVPNLTREECHAFRERERGYRLIEVDPDRLDPYAARAVDTDHVGGVGPRVDTQDLVLVPTGTRVTDDIAPIEPYVEECIAGASQWGETFRADFEATTATNTGTSLATIRDQ